MKLSSTLCLPPLWGFFSVTPALFYLSNVVNAQQNMNMLRAYHHHSETKKIIGGTEAEAGRYPYLVIMRDSFGNQGCAGTLIAAEWVLTAADCQGFHSTVEIGRHNVSDDTEDFESIQIANEIVHPKYNKRNLDYDFMLVHLAEPSNVTNFTTLDDGSINLNLTTGINGNGTNVTTMGWGATNLTTRETSDVLQETELDIVSNKQCKRSYLFTRYTILDSMMCASRNLTDACIGDSGGPLLVKDAPGNNNATIDVQIGIVAWGIGCADLKYPGVYSRVSVAASFIDTVLNCPNIPSKQEMVFDECVCITCEEDRLNCFHWDQSQNQNIAKIAKRLAFGDYLP